MPEHLEYPRILFKSGSEPRIVNSDDEKEAALDDGFHLSEARADAAANPPADDLAPGEVFDAPEKPKRGRPKVK